MSAMGGGAAKGVCAPAAPPSFGKESYHESGVPCDQHQLPSAERGLIAGRGVQGLGVHLQLFTPVPRDVLLFRTGVNNCRCTPRPWNPLPAMIPLSALGVDLRVKDLWPSWCGVGLEGQGFLTLMVELALRVKDF